MMKICPICDNRIKNNDDVVVTMVSKYQEIASDVSFAIDHPTKCLEIVHTGCFDWENYDEPEVIPE